MFSGGYIPANYKVFTAEMRNYRGKASLGANEKSFLSKNGWVILFIVLCSVLYFNATHKKNQVIIPLGQHLKSLKSEKELLVQQKEDLKLQINSQSDPAWIQLTLMKGLGLVPEGQLKVYFYGDDDPY